MKLPGDREMGFYYNEFIDGKLYHRVGPPDPLLICVTLS